MEVNKIIGPILERLRRVSLINNLFLKTRRSIRLQMNFLSSIIVQIVILSTLPRQSLIQNLAITMKTRPFNQIFTKMKHNSANPKLCSLQIIPTKYNIRKYYFLNFILIISKFDVLIFFFWS